MSRKTIFHQLSFLPKVRFDHGGDIGKGKRKTMRPFDPKKAMHVVLRSSRAKGTWSLLHPKNKLHIHRIIYETADRCGVRIYRFVNVGNHIHLLFRAKSRKNFQTFLRIISGIIATLVTGATKANPVGKFWDKLAYSRIVSWGREFKALHAYLIKNLLEALGVWNRKKFPDLKVVFLSLEEAGVPPPRI